MTTQWGELTPWTVSEFHPDPARRMLFYTGIGRPSWANQTPVPVFLSATTLHDFAAERRRFDDDAPEYPIGWPSAGWAGDSGAFTALTSDNPEHPWRLWPDLYGSMWVRLIDHIGPADFVAIQDWPCEPGVRLRTGKTVRDHQELTLESYLYLVDEFPMVPWLPILQGWQVGEYLEHHDMYSRAGVDLAGVRVGIGSVCRRGSQNDIAAVLRALAPLKMRMHGFGVSINGLRLAGHLLASSDSQAWSLTARNQNILLPGCEHLSRPDADGNQRPTDCRNCFRYALHYREEVMDALRANARRRESGEQMSLFDDWGLAA